MRSSNFAGGKGCKEGEKGGQGWIWMTEMEKGKDSRLNKL